MTLLLDPRSLLYRSRGRHFDHLFLLQPSTAGSYGWYALHRRIFAGSEPAAEAMLCCGTLATGTGIRFLATSLLDARRRDQQGRRIAHYFVWLAPPPLTTAAPPDFGAALVTALAPAIDAVFELEPRHVLLGPAQTLESALQRRFSAALPALPLDLGSPPPARAGALDLGPLSP